MTGTFAPATVLVGAERTKFTAPLVVPLMGALSFIETLTVPPLDDGHVGHAVVVEVGGEEVTAGAGGDLRGVPESAVAVAQFDGEPGPGVLDEVGDAVAVEVALVDVEDGRADVVGDGAANVPSPLPRRMPTEVELATAMSNLPSPLKSPMVSSTGLPPVA